jgi:DNA-binding response OmpR family regulator
MVEERGSRVLVVEDDVTIQGLIAEALSDEGLQVRTAVAAREAAAVAASHSPDLVVLDWMLPDGDGRDAARGIRRHCPDVRILVVTADGRAAEKAAEIGAHGCLAKPFDLAALIDAVLSNLPS